MSKTINIIIENKNYVALEQDEYNKLMQNLEILKANKNLEDYESGKATYYDEDTFKDKLKKLKKRYV